MSISAVIPAHNEMESVGDVVRRCKLYCDEIIVIDDGSTDGTSHASQSAGAKVIRNERNLGIVKSLEIGIRAASGDIVVTLDADGQHDPAAIPELVRPILMGKADVVMGKRSESLPLSERLIAKLVNFRVRCNDIGTGYRAVRGDLARDMKFWGFCTCGSFVLEAHSQGAKIVEIPVKVGERSHGASHFPSSRTKTHFKQAILVALYMLVRS
jgi:glycosyltransferase involved in cell wall biosynthesis